MVQIDQYHLLEVILQKMGADPASVAFDTLSSAKANNADVVIIKRQ